MNPRNFFAELKRRNVIRFAGLYLVGAWLLVQVAGTVVPMFGAPAWVPRRVGIFFPPGFVSALVFHWGFEKNAGGLKGAWDVAPAELNVRMVLEGSVRKQEDRVRITAQLIDAKSGFHVWSQTYDRKLQDIFAIQDEIAKAIGNELEVKLVRTGDAGKTSAGTRNLAAYDLYLRGIALWQTRRGEALWQALELFEKAVAADPEFAQAYAGQALVYAVIWDYSGRISAAESFARARDLSERALALDPTLPEPYAA